MTVFNELLAQVATLPSLLPLQLPDPDPVQPPGTEGFNDVMGWGKWVALGVLVMALIFAGVRMGIGNRRGEGGEHASSIGWVLGGVLITAGTLVVAL